MKTSKYVPGQKVNLVIIRKTDLGYAAEINEEDEGLIFYDDVFRDLEFEEEVIGYIKKIREDGAIDLQLQSFGNNGSVQLGDQILEKLKNSNGYIPINAKTQAEDIYDMFGVSKKKFKMALGNLYKRRLVTFTDEGTKLS